MQWCNDVQRCNTMMQNYMQCNGGMRGCDTMIQCDDAMLWSMMQCDSLM